MTNGNVVGEHTARERTDSTLAAVVALGSDVVDETLIGTVSLAQVLRTEAFAVAGAALDWMEAVSRAGFKVARETVGRLDGSTRTALEGAESVTRAVSNALRGSGDLACDFIARTAAPFLGTGPKKAA